MRKHKLMKGVLTVTLFFLVMLWVGLLSGSNLAEVTETSIQNGFYLVTWRGSSRADAPLAQRDERLLEYRYQFLDPSSDRPHEYVIVDVQQRVPIELSEDPESVPVDGGRIPAFFNSSCDVPGANLNLGF